MIHRIAELTVAIVVTNYNNSSYTRELAASLSKCMHRDNLSLWVVDNASVQPDVDALGSISDSFGRTEVILSGSNLGYFPGLNLGLEAVRSLQPAPSIVVVGNNDLIFPINFVEQLFDARESIWANPVVCPNLVTPQGVRQNPHVIGPISPWRELAWDIYYSNFQVAGAMRLVAGMMRGLVARDDPDVHPHAGYIAQGYGACYILGPRFHEIYRRLWSPTFLMGEEYFLAHQLSEHGDRPFYDPRITVTHHDHASLSQVPSRRMWDIARVAHKKYRKYVGIFGERGKL